MGRWHDKYVIGLTGSIGTGKSVVRRMLEHLGAYGIDADALAHRATARGAPGYKPVVNMFGRFILSADLEIDRQKLGKIVFADPEALQALEKIIHPLVLQAIDVLVICANQPVIVIEAIKLVESGISADCDSLWVTSTSPEVQIKRLVSKRRMQEADAQRRIAAQTNQEEKIRIADVVINNSGSFDNTWVQVLTAWEKILLPSQHKSPSVDNNIQDDFRVVRGRPGDSSEIADFLNQAFPQNLPLTSPDIMAAFGEKAFLLLRQGDKLVGLLGWQVENLISRSMDVAFLSEVPARMGLKMLLEEVEKASSQLQCEVSLLFLEEKLENLGELLAEFEYKATTPQSLTIKAWQEAAVESMPENSRLYIKQLRKDRVLRPI